MPRNARIVDPPALIDPATGELDEEFSACLEEEAHAVLFALAEMGNGQFPKLSRLADCHSAAHYEAGELEALISEVERAASLVGAGSPVLRFTGPFHSLCCVAWCHGKDVCVRAE